MSEEKEVASIGFAIVNGLTKLNKKHSSQGMALYETKK